MKLKHKKFTFGNCIWINFIAGLLARLVLEFNAWAALAVFILLMATMIKKQFQANNATTAVMIIINAGLGIGLSFYSL